MEKESIKLNSTEREREIEISEEKFKTCGPLVVTAKDHYNIGSSAPVELRNNPDKTFAEILNDQELSEYLEKLEIQIKESTSTLKEKMKNKPLFEQIDTWVESNLRNDLKKLNLTINYLKSIGRLPQKYDDFDFLKFPLENDVLALRKFLESY